MSLLFPQNIDELKNMINSNSKVKLVGSQHSFNTNFEGEIQISLKHLTGLISINKGTKQVTIYAGTKIYDLNRILHEYQLALPSMGDYDEQTIAGVISTCTHGSGKDVVPIIDYVLQLHIIDSDGNMSTIQDHEQIQVVGCSVGYIACIYAVTIQCVDSFFLEETSECVNMQEEIKTIDKKFNEYDFLEYWLIPYTNYAKKIIRTKKTIQENYGFFNWFLYFLSEIMEVGLCFSNIIFPSWMTPYLFKISGFFLSFFPKTYYCSNSFIVFPHQRRNFEGSLFYNKLYCSEFNSNLNNAEELYNKIKEFWETRNNTTGYLDWAIHLRHIKKSKALISPFFYERNISFSFCVIKTNNKALTLLNQIEDIFASIGDYHPHLGKIFFGKFRLLEDVKRKIEFYKQKYDRKDKFTNGFCKRVF